jgi:AcrR family transcriptional regulator
MSPRTPNQFEQMRKKSIQNIIMSATQLFSEKGVTHVKIADIAKKANISKALVYNYFHSKEDIEIAVIKNCIEVFDKIYQELPEVEDPLSRLENVINLYFSSLQEDYDYWHLYYSIILQPELNARFHEIFQENMQSFSYLDEIFSIIAPKDTYTELNYFSTLLDGIAFEYMLMREKYPLEKMQNRLLKHYRVCFQKNCL